MSIEQKSKILASDVVSSLSEKAPISHASTNTTYGLGTDTDYGHVKLSDSVVSTLDSLSGTATSPKAVDDGLSSLFDNIITAAENAVNTTNIPTNIATELSNRIDELSNDLVDLSGIKDDTILATQLASNLEEANTDILTYAELIEYIAKAERNTGLPLGTLLPYTGKDVPAGTLRADGSTYTNMRSTFPEFYNWVVESGLSVSIADYTLVEGSCGVYGVDDLTGTVRMPTLSAGVFGTTEAGKYGQAVEAGLPNITGEIQTGGGGIRAINPSSTGALDYTAATNGLGGDLQSLNIIKLNAANSNAIYGNSDTVTPSHVKYPWVIVVYNTAVMPSVALDEEIAELLEGKADKEVNGYGVVRTINGVNADEAGNVSDVENIYKGDGQYAIRFTNGLQLVWGYVTIPANQVSATVTMPYAYVAKSYFGTATPNVDDGGQSATIASVSTSSFKVAVLSLTGTYDWARTAWYITVGYWK